MVNRFKRVARRNVRTGTVGIRSGVALQVVREARHYTRAARVARALGVLGSRYATDREFRRRLSDAGLNWNDLRTLLTSGPASSIGAVYEMAGMAEE